MEALVADESCNRGPGHTSCFRGKRKGCPWQAKVMTILQTDWGYSVPLPSSQGPLNLSEPLDPDTQPESQAGLQPSCSTTNRDVQTSDNVQTHAQPWKQPSGHTSPAVPCSTFSPRASLKQQGLPPTPLFFPRGHRGLQAPLTGMGGERQQSKRCTGPRGTRSVPCRSTQGPFNQKAGLYFLRYRFKTKHFTECSWCWQTAQEHGSEQAVWSWSKRLQVGLQVWCWSLQWTIPYKMMQ